MFSGVTSTGPAYPGRVLDHLDDLHRFRHVGGRKGNRNIMVIREIVSRLVDIGRSTDAVQNNIRSSRRHGAGDSKTNAAARACDDGGPCGEAIARRGLTPVDRRESFHRKSAPVANELAVLHQIAREYVG